MKQIESIIEGSKRQAKRYSMVDYMKEIDFNIDYVKSRVDKVNVNVGVELGNLISDFTDEQSKLSSEHNKKRDTIKV